MVTSVALFGIAVLAVLYQPFSWWAFPFLVLFGTVFGGFFAVSFANWSDDRFAGSEKLKYPDQPWMWNKKWRSDKLQSRGLSDLYGTTAFAVITGVFGLVGLASIITGLPEGNLWALLNIIPIGLSAYFGFKLIAAVQNLRAERHLTVLIETRPGWVGREFTVALKGWPATALNKSVAQLELNKVVREVDDDEVWHRKVIERRIHLSHAASPEGTARFSGEIPKDCTPTDWEKHNRWWDLVISSELRGLSAEVRYEVPIADPNRHIAP